MVLAKDLLFYFVCIAAFGASAYAITCQNCASTKDKVDKDCLSGKTKTTCDTVEGMVCLAFSYKGENFEGASRQCAGYSPDLCKDVELALRRLANVTDFKNCKSCTTDLCNSYDLNSAHHFKVPFISIVVGTIISLYVFK